MFIGVFFCLWYNLFMLKRVGIIRGGLGGKYDASLREGGYLLANIREFLQDKYKIVDVLVDKSGVWHVSGVPVQPADLIHKVDLVWNTAESKLSQVIESMNIPHVGVSSFSSLLANNQDKLREHVNKIKLSMPRSVVLPLYQEDFDGDREGYAHKKAKEIHDKFGAPWIVKSYTPDTSMGIHLAKTFPELINAIEDGVKHKKSILVEEFITGKVASMHTMPGFRNAPMYTFPLGASFGNFSREEKDLLIKTAEMLHNHMDAGHYMKSDFVLSSRGNIYLLNINLSPDMKPESHLKQVADSVGAKMHQLVEHILDRA